MRFTKKGSLELSIQSIVIVVIAFVVLGLGLGFVRNQFASIDTTSTAVQEQISQQILDDLRTGNKKLSFPVTKLEVETGEESVQAIGLKNTGDGVVDLTLQFQVKAKDGFKYFESEQELPFTNSGGIETVASISWDNEPQNLKQSQTKVMPVTIKAPDKSGNYLYKIILIDANGDEFDSRTFFVKTN